MYLELRGSRRPALAHRIGAMHGDGGDMAGGGAEKGSDVRRESIPGHEELGSMDECSSENKGRRGMIREDMDGWIEAGLLGSVISLCEQTQDLEFW